MTVDVRDPDAVAGALAEAIQDGVDQAASRPPAVDWLAREITYPIPADPEMGQDEGSYVTFRIGKLLPTEGFPVMEEIRYAVTTSGSKHLGEALLAVSALSAAMKWRVEDSKAFLWTALSQLPPRVVDGVKDKLFRQVYFTRESHPTQTVLFGNEAAAYDGLQPSRIYELLLRAAMVNFTESLSELRFLIPTGLSTRL